VGIYRLDSIGSVFQKLMIEKSPEEFKEITAA
jgi:hypothetical protein